MSVANIKSSNSHICAFCKYWNDRQDTHISHKAFDLWDFDPKAREYCMKRRVERASTSRCSYFEMKL